MERIEIRVNGPVGVLAQREVLAEARRRSSRSQPAFRIDS
jgi:hypothetical protein